MGLFDKVKNYVSPEIFMENLGEKGKKYAQGSRYDVCPACEARSNNIFNIKNTGLCHCFQCGFTGSVIDLHAKITGKSTVEAAQNLADLYGLNRHESERKIQWKRPDAVEEKKKAEEKQGAMQTVVRKLHDALDRRLILKSNPSARRYLIDTRGIAAEVVKTMEERGLVGYLPANPQEAQALIDDAVGRELLEKAGFMKPDAIKAAIAFRPLVFFLPASCGAEFRLIRAPKNQDEPKSIRYGELLYPYLFRGETVSEIVIVEGAIDLMSKIALGEKCTMIALPGCMSWRAEWAERIQKKFGTNRFVVALDSDEAGEKSAAKITEGLIASGFSAVRARPAEGCKDWNEVILKATLA